MQLRFNIFYKADALFALHGITRAASSGNTKTTSIDRLDMIASALTQHLVDMAGGGELVFDEWDGLVQLILLYGPQKTAPGALDCPYQQSLKSLRALSDQFDYFSQPGQGSVIYAGLYLERPAHTHLVYGAVCTPIPGETVCGDAWAIKQNRVLVCDGLGHGIAAAEASEKAVQTFLSQDPAMHLKEVVQHLHLALAGTRGCALAVAEIDPDIRKVRFCGVGNIAGTLISEKTQGLVSKNGTAGYMMGKVQTFEYNWSADALLVMASDGINTRVDLSRYPAVLSRHPAVVASLIHRDFRRENDDATVLVIKPSAICPLG